MDREHRPAKPVNAATRPSATTRGGALPTDPRRKGSTAGSRRRWMLVPCLLGALVLHACGADSEPRTADGTPTGTQLRIKAGQPTHEFSADRLAAPANKPFTIRFTNLDESSHGQHNIEIEDVFKGKTIDGHGQSITYKIGPLRAGNYTFLCTQHPFMEGTLVVE
jgi:plastocyanin